RAGGESPSAQAYGLVIVSNDVAYGGHLAMTAAETTDVAAANGAQIQSSMIRAMVRLLVLVGCGAFVILLVILPLGLRFGDENLGENPGTLFERLAAAGLWPAFLLESALRVAAAGAATWGLFLGLRRLEPALDANAAAQTQFLDTLDVRHVDLAIATAAALSLFLELAVIRWQSSVLEFLAFYKNFSLLACFAGLWVGYALAARNRIPLLMVVPLLAAQFCFVLLVRMSVQELRASPFSEQLTMGLFQADWTDTVLLFLLLSVLFLLTALTFVPIG